MFLLAEHSVHTWQQRIVFRNAELLCSLSYLLDVEVDVDELNPEQVLELNKMATPYGMAEGDFVWSVCC